MVRKPPHPSQSRNSGPGVSGSGQGQPLEWDKDSLDSPSHGPGAGQGSRNFQMDNTTRSNASGFGGAKRLDRKGSELSAEQAALVDKTGGTKSGVIGRGLNREQSIPINSAGGTNQMSREGSIPGDAKAAGGSKGPSPHGSHQGDPAAAQSEHQRNRSAHPSQGHVSGDKNMSQHSKPSFQGAIQDGEASSHQANINSAGEQHAGENDSLGGKEGDDSQFASIGQPGQDVIQEEPQGEEEDRKTLGGSMMKDGQKSPS